MWLSSPSQPSPSWHHGATCDLEEPTEHFHPQTFLPPLPAGCIRAGLPARISLLSEVILFHYFSRVTYQSLKWLQCARRSCWFDNTGTHSARLWSFTSCEMGFKVVVAGVSSAALRGVISVGSVLGQRRRRWPNIDPTLSDCVFGTLSVTEAWSLDRSGLHLYNPGIYHHQSHCQSSLEVSQQKWKTVFASALLSERWRCNKCIQRVWHHSDIRTVCLFRVFFFSCYIYDCLCTAF